MGEAALRLPEPEPFELEAQFDRGDDGGGFSGWSNETILGWLPR